MITKLRWFGIVALAACGSVTEDAPDGPGPGPDAAADAPLDMRPVKVTVLTTSGDGQPELTARVVFQDAAGNVVLDGAVDATGKIESPLPSGGTVTAIRITSDTPAQLRADLATITGAAPGDELTIGAAARPTITNQGGQTSMSATYTPVTGAASHQFFTTCGTASAGTTSPATLNFRDSCHGATFDLVGVASGGSLATPRFVKLTNIGHANGGTFAIPGGFASMGSFTINTQNVPPEISSLSATRASMLANAAVAPQSVSEGDPGAGTVVSTVPFPAGVGTRSAVTVSLQRAGAAGIQQHAIHTATLATAVNIDLDAQVVPWLANLNATPSGATWTTPVGGGNPDGALTRWAGQWAEGSRTVTVSWRIAHPFAATGITLPRLPPAHAALDPQAQSATVTPTAIGATIVDLDAVAGYGEFRRRPDTLVTPSLDDMGAFTGMPLSRRLFQATVLR